MLLEKGGRVFVGRDTRPSGGSLVAAVSSGVKAVGGIATDLGVVTTPQLHYVGLLRFKPCILSNVLVFLYSFDIAYIE